MAELPDRMPYNDLTIYALADNITYTVTYISESETYATQNYIFAQTIVPPADPEKTGFRFTGWTPSLPATMPVQDLTVTAQFEAVRYILTFTVSGETYSSSEYFYGDVISAPSDPTKTGAVFSNWSPAVPATMPPNNLTIAAVFEDIDYTLTLIVDGETYIEHTYHYGEAISAPANPSPGTGRLFDCWNPRIPESMPAQDVTCTAQFTYIEYTITYMASGQTYTTQNYHYNQVVSAPVSPTPPTGKEFTGWSPALPSNMPAQDLTVTAQFGDAVYTLTYMDGASVHATQTYNYGQTVSLPADPAKTGKTFTGWYPEVPQTMPSRSLTTYAQYDSINYTVTYMADNQLYTTQTYVYGQTIVPPANPLKSGYRFTGWTPSLPATMPAQSLTVDASFSDEVYTFTYNVNNAVYTTQTYRYGDTVVPPSDPVQSGKTFSGWYPAIPQAATRSMTFTGDFGDYSIVKSLDDLPLFRERLVNSSDGSIRPGNIITPTLGDLTYKYGQYLRQVYVAGEPVDYYVQASSPTDAEVNVLLPIYHDGALHEVTWLATRNAAGGIMTIGGVFAGTSQDYIEITGAVFDNETHSWYEEITTPEGTTLLGNRLSVLADDTWVQTDSSGLPVIISGYPVWTRTLTFEGSYLTTHSEDVEDLTEIPLFIRDKETGNEQELTLSSSDVPFGWKFVPTDQKSKLFNAVADKFWEFFLAWYNPGADKVIVSTKSVITKGFVAERATLTQSEPDVTVYIYDGQTLYSAVTGKPGDAFAPATPVKEGYTFTAFVPEITAFPATDAQIQISWT